MFSAPSVLDAGLTSVPAACFGPASGPSSFTFPFVNVSFPLLARLGGWRLDAGEASPLGSVSSGADWAGSAASPAAGGRYARAGADCCVGVAGPVESSPSIGEEGVSRRLPLSGSGSRGMLRLRSRGCCELFSTGLTRRGE